MAFKVFLITLLIAFCVNGLPSDEKLESPNKLLHAAAELNDVFEDSTNADHTVPTTTTEEDFLTSLSAEEKAIKCLMLKEKDPNNKFFLDWFNCPQTSPPPLFDNKIGKLPIPQYPPDLTGYKFPPNLKPLQPVKN